jgi:hypothetical protein
MAGTRHSDTTTNELLWSIGRRKLAASERELAEVAAWLSPNSEMGVSPNVVL